MKIKKIIHYLCDSDYRFLVNAARGMYDDWDDEKFLRRKFEAHMGRKLNLIHPKSFNEKLQWLKLNVRNPQYTTMVDKYAVKEYIATVIGEQYVIPTLGVWDRFEDIDFRKLPNQFVLKCTHDSGGLVICKDKSKLDIEKARKKIQASLKRNYYYVGREWPYKNVVPRIIAEEYLEQPGKSELTDYKVLCFGGKSKLIEIHLGRYTKRHTQDFYDTNWHKTNISQGSPLSDTVLPRPDCLEKMIELSEKLAKGIPHVRVDWYYINGKLLFGELTFYDGSGFEAFDRYDDDLLLGKWIKV